MMASFEDLGIRESLLHAVEDQDIQRPTALQEAVIPVLRRGGNLVARSSAGAGKTLAYALGVLDRLEARDPETDDVPGARVLVLAPTPETAEGNALSLVPFAQAAGLTVAIPGERWGTPLGEAEVVVATPEAAMEAVRASGLKLGEVEALILDGASDIRELGGWDAVETLFDHAPRDAQRIVISATLSPEVEDFCDRRVRRALRFPAEPAVSEGPPPRPTGQVGYVLVPEREKLDLVARLIRRREEDGAVPTLLCRSDERAAEVAEALTIRGFLVGDLDDPDADVVIAAADVSREELSRETGEQPERTVSYDAPADPETLLARHAGDPHALVFVEPRELTHLREIARRAGLEPLPVPPPLEEEELAAELSGFRRELGRALREEDLGAQMLVLEPLLEEWSALEVAAAAAALLRKRRVESPPPAVAIPAAPRSESAPANRETSEVGPPPATWARLYVGIGSRDGVRPGDLVGAIAGEANIPGSRVGRIDIRDTFSIVEVQADVADQVIRAVNGTTIKGRSARVDYDRGGERGAKRPAGGRGDAPPRRDDPRRSPVRRPPPRD